LLPWQDELIEQLTDTSDAVRQAARRSLILLSFYAIRSERMANGDHLGVAVDEKSVPKPSIVDFGPKPQAARPAQEEAARKWRAWWTEHGGLDKAKRSEIRSAKVDSDPEKEAALLSSALVYAEPAEQAEKLARYRKEKGVVYTEAIADALPQLNGE